MLEGSGLMIDKIYHKSPRRTQVSKSVQLLNLNEWFLFLDLIAVSMMPFGHIISGMTASAYLT